MRFVSSLEMRRLDKAASKIFGIPPLILMENAGRALAEEAASMAGAESVRVAVISGWGNNGGDGFVAARHLINKGYKVKVYLAGRKRESSPEARINFMILKKMAAMPAVIPDSAGLLRLKKALKNFPLLIDAVFGIGLKGELDKFYAGLFNMLNESSARILSADIPSGLNADTGKPSSAAIFAERTVTFGFPKKGFLKPSAKKYLGKLVIADISLPGKLLNKQ